jgi:hypothetical protein
MKNKYYQVKVYNNAGTYLTTWSDIVSSVEFSNEINSAGGQLKFILARSAGDYGEGSDLDFNHKVKVYVFDKEEPEGKLIFQGYISAYTPIYKNDKVEVTILSFGAELNDFILDGVKKVHIQQTTKNSYQTIEYLYNGTNDYWRMRGQEMYLTSPTNIDLSGVTFNLALDSGSVPVPTRVKVLVMSYIPTSPSTIPFYDMYNNNYSALNVAVYDELFVDVDSTTPKDYEITFSNLISLNMYNTLFIALLPTNYAGSGSNKVRIATKASGGYSEVALWAGSVAGSQFLPYGEQFYYKLHYKEAATKSVFNSYDPSQILKDCVTNYVQQNGSVNYSDTTIDMTGTEVSYTFNVNSTLEAINKCVELAPRDWYWYLDYGSNLINFHKKKQTPDHTFNLEKDIIDAKFEKRIESIVNTIYFTGGDTGGGENLFKKYTVSESINKYGIKAMKYSDQRVTNTTTADTIANSILEQKSFPELRVVLEILDSNNNQNMGYDIESIKVGDTVAVRNITQQVGLSTWDYARWDQSYWDYNIYNLSSLTMQVIKLTYKENSVVLEASTIPTDVNKRIEDINRNLEVLQTLNNPTIPT